jgi:hypothetical protein
MPEGMNLGVAAHIRQNVQESCQPMLGDFPSDVTFKVLSNVFIVNNQLELFQNAFP